MTVGGSKPATQRGPGRRDRRYRPTLELLEDRTVPAIFTTAFDISAVAGRPFIAQVASFIDTAGARDPSEYSIVSIDWGDNISTFTSSFGPLDSDPGTITYNGAPGSTTDPFFVTAGHTYASPGTYSVTVVIGRGEDFGVSNTGFHGAYALDHWDSSGIAEGTTSITPASGSSNFAQFSYNVSSSTLYSVSSRTASFSSTAAGTGPVFFNWSYTGSHNAHTFQVFADGPSGRQTITLVDSAVESGSFEYFGSATIDVNAGFDFGFIVGGSDIDLGQMSGTLTVSNLGYPARATVITAPFIGGPSSVLAGQTYTLELAYQPQPGETVHSWTINWGDGRTDVIAGNPNLASHVYLGSATAYTITASISSSRFGIVESNSQFVTVPLVAISGPPTVNRGQVYALNLTYQAPGERDVITSWTIDWGDGSLPEVFAGSPATVTHVYRDAPNAYLISATVTTAQRGKIDAQNQLLVDVLVPSIVSADSTAIDGPGTTTVTTPDRTATAIVSRAFNYPDPLIVFLAHYGRNPALGIDPSLSQIGGTTVVNTPDGPRVELTLYDLRVNNARPGDVVVVFFSVPQPSFLPQLRFIDDVTGLPLPIVGSTDPALVARYGVTPRLANGAFVVVLDFNTSFPTLTRLNGTVFTITDVAGFVPPVFNLFAPGLEPTRNLAASNDVLGTLLGGDDDDDDGGTQIGVVVPAQVATYNVGGSSSDASEEARLRQRELLRTIEAILEQIRQVFGMQIQLVVTGVSATAVEPASDEPASDMVEPLVSTAAQPEAELVLWADPFADDPAPAGASPLDRQLLSYLALAAMPFVPWSSVFAPVGPERERYVGWN